MHRAALLCLAGCQLYGPQAPPDARIAADAAPALDAAPAFTTCRPPPEFVDVPPRITLRGVVTDVGTGARIAGAGITFVVEVAGTFDFFDGASDRTGEFEIEVQTRGEPVDGHFVVSHAAYPSAQVYAPAPFLWDRDDVTLHLAEAPTVEAGTGLVIVAVRDCGDETPIASARLTLSNPGATEILYPWDDAFGTATSPSGLALITNHASRTSVGGLVYPDTPLFEREIRSAPLTILVIGP